MTGKCNINLENGCRRWLLMIGAVFIFVGVWGIAGGEAVEKSKSPYVGTWKLEKLMPEPGQEWLEAKYPFIMQLLADGKLEILIPAPNQTIHITGTWKILADGRLQVSQEGENGKAFERPAIIVFSPKNGKLASSARAYVNENAKAQPGFIFRKDK
jgi:hypothetical protein